MTRTDRKTLFTALAFFAVAVQGKKPDDPQKAKRVLELAELVESFCAEYVSSVAWAAADETGTLVVDGVIEQYIGELRGKEETRLPDDRASLINIHDRLQQRKTRRVRRDFYAFATEDQIADVVLTLLDEELNDASHKALV
jgi:hypothetical protein